MRYRFVRLIIVSSLLLACASCLDFTPVPADVYTPDGGRDGGRPDAGDAGKCDSGKGGGNADVGDVGDGGDGGKKSGGDGSASEADSPIETD
ncbi:MAG: hypothetical protein NVS3B20_15610 [Polyangiales bacterium]